MTESEKTSVERSTVGTVVVWKTIEVVERLPCRLLAFLDGAVSLVQLQRRRPPPCKIILREPSQFRIGCGREEEALEAI